MSEQFSAYPEVRWMASTAVQFINKGGRVQVNPDLKNFKLLRFKDLRKHPNVSKKRHFKLMLTGSSKTHIFIDGPASQIDLGKK